MAIRKTLLTGAWGLKLPALILAGYFCFLLPAVSIFFRESNWAGDYVYPLYYALALFFLAGYCKTNPKTLGFSRDNLWQNILIGGVSGGALVLSVPLLDGLLDVSGLGEAELFAGAELRARQFTSPFAMAGSILLLPVLEQAFFSGFILQSLLRKFKTVIAVYLSAVIFCAAHFNFSLGGFAVGLITAALFCLTGTLYAGILLQISCGVAAGLIAHVYPRLTTLLTFLY